LQLTQASQHVIEALVHAIRSAGCRLAPASPFDSRLTTRTSTRA
jgi:hypothetical protein